MKIHKIYKYLFLKHKVSKRNVRGTELIRQFNIAPNKLTSLFDYSGICGFGPALIKNPYRQAGWIRYAKSTAFVATFRYFFTYQNRIRCVRDKTYRKGKHAPFIRSLRRERTTYDVDP